MTTRTEGLADTLKNEVEKILAQKGVKECFDGNRIVLVVKVDGVSVKIAAPALKKPSSRPRLTKLESAKIKEVKTTLKEHLDIAYLIVLLMRVKQELKKVVLSGLDANKKQMIKDIVLDVNKDLSTKLLEVK